MKKKKITIIGGGNVGASVAHYVAQIVEGSHQAPTTTIQIIDIVPNLTQEKAFDFNMAANFVPYKTVFESSEKLSDMKEADIVVHTAGIARKPGMDRLDLIKTNVKIAREVSQAIKTYVPNAIVIVVANPLDVIAMTCFRETGFSKERVIGMAGVLDSARNSFFIAEALGNKYNTVPIKSSQVNTQVLGGHGDAMVPLTQYSAVAGISAQVLLDDEQLTQLEDRTCHGGAEIVGYLKTGSAFYAPAASVSQMITAIILNEKRIFSASVYLNGEYGHKDIFLGVPIIMSNKGIEKIIELPLNDRQKEMMQNSVKMVKSGLEQLNSI